MESENTSTSIAHIEQLEVTQSTGMKHLQVVKLLVQQAAPSDSCQSHCPKSFCPVEATSGSEEVCGLGEI